MRQQPSCFAPATQPLSVSAYYQKNPDDIDAKYREGDLVYYAGKIEIVLIKHQFN
jgi:hypothetical protein